MGLPKHHGQLGAVDGEGGGGEKHVLCSSQYSWLYELRGYERLDLCWKALLLVRSEKVMLILCMCAETYEKVIIGCTHATCISGTGGVTQSRDMAQPSQTLLIFGPSGVRALPLAAGINVGGHYFR